MRRCGLAQPVPGLPAPGKPGGLGGEKAMKISGGDCAKQHSKMAVTS
jgi:hypothetical protein